MQPTGQTTPTGVNPALTSPLAGANGLTAPTGVNPALTSPLAGANGLTGLPGEVPISAPVDPQTFPLLGGGDPSMGMGGLSSAAPASGGGLMSELSNAVNQLGANQAIDLLKGVVVPSIMQAIKGAAPAAAAPAALPAPPGLPIP